MSLSVEQFLTQLTKSDVLSVDDARSLLAALPEGQRPSDGEALARELIRQKKLTPFQAKQIFAGKGPSLVLGNYIILDKLGQGGMGMVLKAQHKRMKRLVALKVISPAALKSPDALKRFLREVEAAAKLRHPNIVAADDADEAKGTHFLVMEYVDGSDLSALVKKHGPLPVEQAVRCIIQAARGLEFAHEQGVIHRDIKPANLLIDSKGTVKILDMGLARIDGAVGGSSEGAGLTSTGTIMGTVDYMSPEQAMDTKHADVRSDIYSLGCSLYYLLTGKCVYDGDTMMKKLMAHQNAAIPSLAEASRVGRVIETHHDAPTTTAAGGSRGLDPPYEALNSVFRRMVAKRPEDRPQSMTAVIAELERCLASNSSTVVYERSSGSATNVTASGASDSGNELQDFLRQMSGGEPATATSDKASGTVVTPSSAEAETMISSGDEAGTDPRTEHSLTLERSGAPMGVNPRTVRGLTSSGSPKRKLKWLIGSIAAAVVVLLAIVFAVRGKSGTLHLEINDELIEVTLGDTGRTVKGKTTHTLQVPLGELVLHIQREDLAFDTNPFEVTKGENVPIKVERVGRRVRAMMGNTLLGHKESPQTQPPSELNAKTTTAGNYALRFSRSQDHVEIAPLGIDLTQPFTVELWAERGQSTKSAGPIWFAIMFGERVTLNYFRQSMGWQFGANRSPHGVSVSEMAKWNTTGKRLHVAGQWTGRELQIYVDGKRQSYEPWTNLEPGTDAASFVKQCLQAASEKPIKVGQLQARGTTDPGAEHSGTIDSLRISRGVKYTDDFVPGDLVRDVTTEALYRFDEGQGDVLRDSSGNNHHGKIVGAKWVRVDGSSIAPTATAPAPPSDGTVVPLFNGKDLTGWTPFGGRWKWEDGELVTTEPSVVLTLSSDVNKLTLKKDFEVSFQARLANQKGMGNFQFRKSADGNQLGMCGFSTEWGWGSLFVAGSNPLPEKPRPESQTAVRLEDFNDVTIRCVGKRVTIKINGVIAQDGEFDLPLEGQIAWDVRHAASEFRVRNFQFKDLSLAAPANNKPVSPINPGTTSPPPAKAPFDAKTARAHQEAWAKHLGVPVEYTNSIGMKFMLIPPGEFMMGFDPKDLDSIKNHIIPEGFRQGFAEAIATAAPLHKVRITRPFYIQMYEVSNGQYQKIIGKLPENNDPNLPDTALMRDVALIDAVRFCDELSRKEGKTPAHQIRGDRATRILDANGYRLPTEAEWEYTCRAGTTTLWFLGDDRRVASDSSILREYQSSHVGTAAKPNPFGLFDQYGGSTEFCFDRYAPYGNEPVADPFEQPDDSGVIVRGNSMFSGGGADVRAVSSATRLPSGWQINTYTGLGRVVLPIEIPAQGITTGVKESRPKEPIAWAGWSKDAPAPAVAPFDAAQAKTHQEAWAKHLGVPVEYSNSIGMKFMLIPPGEFTMGSTPEEIETTLNEIRREDTAWRDRAKSEGPQHLVRLTRPIYLGTTEVTQAQYEGVIGKNPSHFSATGAGRKLMNGVDTKSHPVETVSWHEVIEFCSKLGQREKLTGSLPHRTDSSGQPSTDAYGLPTEAEWEFACRAGTTTSHWTGNDESSLARGAHFGEQVELRTYPVGQLEANPFGLFDTHGNVWEWVRDGWDQKYYSQLKDQPVVDPLGVQPPGGMRVQRGGASRLHAVHCRSSNRGSVPPDMRLNGWGFRVALSVDAVKKQLAAPQETTALQFDGSGARVEIPSLVMDPTRPMTIEAWVQPSKPVTMGIVAGFADQGVLQLRGRQWWFSARDGKSVMHNVVATADVDWQKPSHVAGVWDGSHLRLFVNGIRHGEPVACSDVMAVSGMATLGAASHGKDAFAGQILQARFSRVARYMDDFDPPATLTRDADATGLFHFDQGQGAELTDSSDYGRHGKIVNARWVTIPGTPATGTAGHQSKSPAVTQSAGAAPLDLIALFDIDKGVAPWRSEGAKNLWLRETGELTFNADGKPGLVKFPTMKLLDANYRLELEFTRTSGTNGFNLDLPMSSGLFSINLDEGDRGRTGLGKSDQFTDSFHIEPNRRYRLTVIVEGQNQQDSIRLEVDGKPLLAWQGDRQKAAIPTRGASAENTKWPGIWVPARGSSFTIHRLQVLQLSSETQP